PDEGMPGVHEDLGRRVVEVVGVHRPEDEEVVRDSRRVREETRERSAAAAVPAERVRRAQERRDTFDEGEPLALDDILRNLLAVVRVELRLRVEEIDLGGPPGHEQEDDALGLGREVSRLRGQRVGGDRGPRPEELRLEEGQQGESSDAESPLLEEVTPGDAGQRVRRGGHAHSFVSDSSRFRRPLATTVQAARTGSSDSAIPEPAPSRTWRAARTSVAKWSRSRWKPASSSWSSDGSGNRAPQRRKP